ncbi:MAG: trehalose-phosphatase [Bdellovibrionota bacterium]
MSLEPSSKNSPDSTRLTFRLSTPAAVVSRVPTYGPLSIILDKDGTLDPKVTKRDEARVAPQVVEQIERLIALEDVDVALISGRSVQELRNLVGQLPIKYYGLHGAEGGRGDESTLFLSPDKDTHQKVALFSHQFRIGLRESKNWSEEQELSICEEKDGKGFAAHWRAYPDLESDIQNLFTDVWQAFPHREDFHIQNGDCVIELKLPSSKGDALSHYLKERDRGSWESGHILVIGDDETDISMMKIAQSSMFTSTSVIVENLHITVPDALYVSSPTEVFEILTGIADKRAP